MSAVAGSNDPTSFRSERSGRLLRYIGLESKRSIPAEWHKLNIKIEALRSTGRTLVVQFVGPVGQVGTTIVASGFAMAAAQRLSEYRNPTATHTASLVLLVDCDPLPAKARWARREQHQAETLLQAFKRDQNVGTIIGAPISNGVVRAKLGAVDSEGAPKCAPEELTRLFEAVRDQFALVVLDSPALDASLASLLLAAHCDGTLMVVRAANTKNSDLHSARQELEQAGGRVVGVVFNRAASHGERGWFGLRN